MPLESESYKTCPRQFLFGRETLTFHMNLEVEVGVWDSLNYAVTVIICHYQQSSSHHPSINQDGSCSNESTVSDSIYRSE